MRSWKYNGIAVKEVPMIDNSVAYGFVYLITNKINGRLYIGKKFFWFKKTLKPLKGSKRKRHSLYESDWKTYFGSSNSLTKDIEKHGIESFDRKILRLCRDKFECSYYEMKEQVEREVLFHDIYYNGLIRVRLSKYKRVKTVKPC